MSIFVRDGFVCAMCRRVVGDTAKLVCDHIRPHKGDSGMFWDGGNLQTLCKSCHDSTKQRAEIAAERGIVPREGG